MLVKSWPADAFVPDGYYPTTPKRTGMTLGSYGAQGNAATGEASIRFDANKQAALLAIPVAGYPLISGIKVEVEQNGKLRPVIMKATQGNLGDGLCQGQQRCVFHPSYDLNPTAWLAVGAPFVTGRLDALTNGLLANYFVFIVLGMAVVVVLIIHGNLTSRLTKTLK